MKKAKNARKALLIISDGGDNNSRYTETEVKNLVREADVQIYAIGIFEPAGHARPDRGGNGRTQPPERNRGTDRRTALPCGEH
jgi:Ca-activated chloride channel family protein